MDSDTGFGDLSRRRWLQAIGAFAVFALIDELRPAAAATAAKGIGTWLDRQAEIALALQHGELRPSAWMDEVEALANRTDLAELMRAVKASKLSSPSRGATNDPIKRFVRFVDDHGAPRELPYGTALFSFAPDNVITPHGHRYMASAHLVAEGQFRIRTFDRIDEEPNAIVIKPREDYIARVGQVSTMSSERNNIHWFVPDGGPATTFDVIISGLDGGSVDYEIKAIDPLRGQRRAGGLIAAPIIGFEEASRIYTRDL